MGRIPWDPFHSYVHSCVEGKLSEISCATSKGGFAYGNCRDAPEQHGQPPVQIQHLRHAVQRPKRTAETVQCRERDFVHGPGAIDRQHAGECYLHGGEE